MKPHQQGQGSAVPLRGSFQCNQCASVVSWTDAALTQGIVFIGGLDELCPGSLQFCGNVACEGPEVDKISDTEHGLGEIFESGQGLLVPYVHGGLPDGRGCVACRFRVSEGRSRREDGGKD